MTSRVTALAGLDAFCRRHIDLARTASAMCRRPERSSV
ncbi:putative leader peptide [Aquipuribacter hungaricus]|uniref:Leader peptide n=1 Tax=Aquipuribacter hungaricus TaxID=545624 RepID=A0ABV7WIA4_9MICO